MSGRVVEVGAGNGMNFAHYPATVTEVVAVEPEPYLRARAVERAADAPVPICVVDGTAEALPVEDGSVDVVVVSLVLCSVRDQSVALAEARRALRPGGELRIYEHVGSEVRWRATAERAFTHTLWKRMSGGCHLDRHTDAAISAAGFTIDSLERFRFQGVDHVLGVAHAPAG